MLPRWSRVAAQICKAESRTGVIGFMKGSNFVLFQNYANVAAVSMPSALHSIEKGFDDNAVATVRHSSKMHLMTRACYGWRVIYLIDNAQLCGMLYSLVTLRVQRKVRLHVYRLVHLRIPHAFARMLYSFFKDNQ